MNRKQLITLLIAGLVIGGLGVFVYNRKAASWKPSDQASGKEILPNFPLNDIVQVTIKEPTNEVTLAKVDDQWKVQERWNYPANFSEVRDLLRTIWELKGVQSQKIGPSQYARMQLVPPGKDGGTNTATLVTFKDKGGKEGYSLLLGKKATRDSGSASPLGGDYPVGRYVARSDNPQTVWLVSETFSNVEAKADRWLNKEDFFKVEKLRSISVTHPGGTNSWTLVREKEGGDLQLADKKEGEEFDKNKAYSAGNALSWASFTDVLNPEAKPEEIGLDNPVVAKLETFDNFVYTIRTAKAKGTNENDYTLQMNVQANLAKERTPGTDEKPEDKEKLDKEFKDNLKKLEEKLAKEKACEKWTYLVSKYTVEPLLKPRSEFMAEKKADEPKADTTSSSATAPVPAAPLPVATGLLPDAPPPLPDE
ncbi:MAG: DUF4340 domain-containing protein [Verrucomicrobiia bacterium]